MIDRDLSNQDAKNLAGFNVGKEGLCNIDNAFLFDDSNNKEVAKRAINLYCNKCPVDKICLYQGIKHDLESMTSSPTVYGGTTVKDRKRIFRSNLIQLRIAAAASEQYNSLNQKDK